MAELHEIFTDAQEKISSLTKRLDHLSKLSKGPTPEVEESEEQEVAEEVAEEVKEEVEEEPGEGGGDEGKAEEDSSSTSDASENETSGDLLRRIDQYYWRLCTDVLASLLPDEGEEVLLFGPETGDLLSFGYLGIERQSFLPGLIAGFRDLHPDDLRFPLLYLEDALQERFSETKLFGEIQGLRDHGDSIDQRIQVNQASRVRYIQGFMQAIDAHVADENARGSLKEALKAWAKYLLPTLQMERKLNTRGLATREERLLHIQLQSMYKKHFQTIQRLARSQDSERQLVPRLEEMIDEFELSIRLEEEKKANQQQVEAKREESGKISRVDVRLALEEEVHYFRAISRLSSRWARTSPSPLPLQERGICRAEDMFQILDVVKEYDPAVFRNRLANRRGIPPFLILPGTGNGAYDWKNNRLAVPLVHPRTILESVASAVIHYRIDVDRHVNDRELIRSFWDLKEMKKTRSVIKVQQRMIAEYVTWIVKESRGFRVMEKEIRVWFELKIAPDKNEVKRPPEYNFLTLKEITAFLEKLEGEQSPDTLYRRGVLTSLRDRKDQGVQEEALRLVEEAIELHPEEADYHYTRGILCKRTRKKRKAGLAFREYIRLAPQSWWSRKAQEHLV